MEMKTKYLDTSDNVNPDNPNRMLSIQKIQVKDKLNASGITDKAVAECIENDSDEEELVRRFIIAVNLLMLRPGRKAYLAYAANREEARLRPDLYTLPDKRFDQTLMQSRAWAAYISSQHDDIREAEAFLNQQRKIILQNLEGTLVEAPIVGEYVSIYTKSTYKDELQELVRDAEAGKFSHVIVEDYMRLDKHPLNAFGIYGDLIRRGIRVIAANSSDRDQVGHLEGILYFEENGNHTPMSVEVSTTSNGACGLFYTVSGMSIKFRCNIVDAEIPVALERATIEPKYKTLLSERFAMQIEKLYGKLPQMELLLVGNAAENIGSRRVAIHECLEDGQAADDFVNMLNDINSICEQIAPELDAGDARYSPFLSDWEYAFRVSNRMGYTYIVALPQRQREVLELILDKVTINAKGEIRFVFRSPFTLNADLTTE